MSTKTLSFVFAITTIALGIFAYQQHQTIQSLRNEIASLPKAAITKNSPSSSPNSEIESEASTQKSAQPVPATIAASATDENDADSGSSQRLMRDFSKMMENPSVNEMMQASQRGALTVLYGDLVESLGLEGEEKEHFFDLLMARQMFRVETSMKLMGGGVSDEERRTLTEEMKEYDQVVKDEIEFFLNDDEDLESFDYYEKTMQDRMSLSGFEASLAKAGNPLEEGVDEKLIRIMSEERDRFDFTSDLTDAENYDLSANRFSEENIARFEKDLIELFELIAARASSVLNPEQQIAFVENQSQMRELQVSQMRMAANMFRNSGPNP